LNIPSKFGSIAKAYVTRGQALNVFESQISMATQQLNNLQQSFENSILDIIDAVPTDSDIQTSIKLNNFISENLPQMSNVVFSDISTEGTEIISTINIYLLGYNNQKQLVGNPHVNTTLTNDNLPNTLLTNIKNYLGNFNLLTDTITINDGYIVNFGVIFDVIAEKYANKQQVKLNCIQKIKDYFSIEKMQFNQPIYKSELEFELMGVEGVRSIGHVTLTQKDDYNSDVSDANLEDATYSYSREGGEFTDQTTGEGTPGYGYKYDFSFALSDDGTIILPPETSTPTVFELKNPNTNIQGRVR